MNEIDRILSAKDAYSVLDLGRQATKEEVKKSYRRLSLLVHPDKSTDTRATQAFQKLTDSYNSITNPAVRKVNKPTQPYDPFRDFFSKHNKTKPRYSPSDPYGNSYKQKTFPCKGVNKDGVKCMNRVNFQGTECNNHRYKSKCQARTKNNTKCANFAKDGGIYCSVHTGYNPNAQNIPKPVKQEKCKAKTKTGEKCQNSSKSESIYCGVHKNYNPNAQPVPKPPKQEKCKAKTKNGENCKNASKDGSIYCGVHKNYKS